MLKTVGFPSTRTGDQTIVNGNLVIGTAGKGIDFSADPHAAGMTSELLDDYEEGTWVPTLTDSINNATTTANNAAYYTKVGRIVTVSAYVQTSALGSVSGGIRVGNLPFTIDNNNRARAGATAGFGSGLNITAGQSVGLYALPNTTTLVLTLWNNIVGTTQMQAAEWSNDGAIYFSISYVAA
jgi:hypothetical protein